MDAMNFEFRAYCKGTATSEMIYSESRHLTDFFGEIEELGSEYSPAMPFIGLLDKNGKKIFAGDILFVKDLLPFSDKGNAVVIYSNETASFVLKWLHNSSNRTAGECYGIYSLNESYQVIGNIYDNPDLAV